jgi:hypothetical protein
MAGWRDAAATKFRPQQQKQHPDATRARPSTTTLEQFLTRKPATPPSTAPQQAASAEQVNTYLASLGLPPVPPGVDPMAAMVMAMQSAMYAPPPPDPWAGYAPPFDPWAGYYDPWAAGALYDPWAAYYAPSPDAPLDQWQAEQVYASQPSAWSSAYGGA